MQEKYTEDIDKLDSFYQEALDQAFIEPPTGMWDKISTSYAEQKKPAPFFKKRYTLLLLLLLVLISSTGIYLYLKNKSDNPKQEIQKENNPENTNPEIKNNPETENNSGNVQQQSTKTKIQSTNQKSNTDNNKPETSSDPVNETNTLVEEARPVVVESTPAAKPDSVSSPKETPKKKLNFREKHTQNVKGDSLRPLFVPVK